MPQLSLEDRQARMSRLLELVRAIFGRRLRDTKAIHGSKLAGMPRELLFAWMCNVEAHRVFVKEHPTMAKYLVQHALDTDDLETSFGMLSMKGRGKNPGHITLSIQDSVDHLFEQRSLDTATRGYALTGGSGIRKRSLGSRRKRKVMTWINGKASGRSGLARHLRHEIVRRVNKRARIDLRDRRTVRGFRVKKNM